MRPDFFKPYATICILFTILEIRRIESRLYQSEVIDEFIFSNVTCNGNSCEITNACVTSNNGVMLFGSEDHVFNESVKLKPIVKQNYKCSQCDAHVPVERKSGSGKHFFHDSTATLAAGLDNRNCGHQLGDVIWPMIRLNLKYRSEKDVILNGLGTLFVETSKFYCSNLYKPLAYNMITYNSLVKNEVCFNKLLVGTDGENYSSSANGIVKKNFSRDMRVMRSLYYKMYDIKENQKMDHIIISIKRSYGGGTHFLNIHNIREVVDMLTANFPSYEVMILSWEDYSMKDQLKLLARTKVYISLPGAALMNGAFLQDRAILISFCRNDGSGRRTEGVEYNYWFNNLDYGKFLMFCKNDEMSLIGYDTNVKVDKLKKTLYRLDL